MATGKGKGVRRSSRRNRTPLLEQIREALRKHYEQYGLKGDATRKELFRFIAKS